MVSRIPYYIQQRLGNSLRKVHSDVSPDTLKFCVVGSGPSGFYTVDKILKRLANVQVDIIEALPNPFGLIRSGVAPDHQDTKNVINQFTSIAKDPRVAFFGNTPVGTGLLPLHKLRSLYDGVVLAYGAESDRKLDIPGEDSQGIFSAREFVWWYNGHPSSAARLPIDLRSVHSVAICGLGNVAIDCARVLLRPVEDLARTDIALHAAHALQESAVKEVHLLGRRGPAQAAFTPKELRELLNIHGVSVYIHPQGCLELQQACKDEIAGNRIKKRVVEVLQKIPEKSSTGQSKSLHIHFLRSPVEFTRDTSTQQVTGIVLDSTSLQPSSKSGEKGQKAVSTGIIEHLAAQLVLTSIGYRSLPIEGASFDEHRGIIPNVLGQVLTDDGSIDPGLFVCGWLKRGPTGIIGTNLVDAEQTVDTLVRYYIEHESTSIKAGRDGLIDYLNRERDGYFDKNVITFDDWLTIDMEERRVGQERGKPREKCVTIDGMVAIAKQ